MILKIDLEKAFYRIEWYYIRDIMSFSNFPTKFSNLIMFCITTSFISIIVNGDTIDYFKPSWGIRQGGPISPYIFILCMERLFRTIDEVVGNKTWNPIGISMTGPKISHLFFDDDLTLLSRADPLSCVTISRILNEFCSNSGQKLNLSKSKVIFSTKCGKETQEICTSILNIQPRNTFGKYHDPN